MIDEYIALKILTLKRNKMGLSVTEKQNIKEIIENRIDREIERIQTENKPAADDIKEQARAQTLAALNITDQISELQSIKEQITELGEQKKQLEGRILEMLGVDMRKANYGYGASSEQAIESKIASASRSYEKNLLNAHPILGKIVTLRQEKDNLLQSVWIATSNVQVKQLFDMVNQLLASVPTELESMAQNIPPDTTV